MRKIGIGSINWPVGSIPDRVYAHARAAPSSAAGQLRRQRNRDNPLKQGKGRNIRGIRGSYDPHELVGGKVGTRPR